MEGASCAVLALGLHSPLDGCVSRGIVLARDRWGTKGPAREADTDSRGEVGERRDDPCQEIEDKTGIAGIVEESWGVCNHRERIGESVEGYEAVCSESWRQPNREDSPSALR